MIAEALSKKTFVSQVLPVETNIIIAELSAPWTPAMFVEKMKEQDILLFAFSPTRFRMVTHLDISPEMIARTIDVIDHL
jgi:threonine aldolase